MKVVGLFAGIGGFELGLSRSGHHTALLCEIWEPARAVLASNFPLIPCARDIRELESLPSETDLVVAGFPCQDLSQAGQTAGISGQKSGLVAHVFRLIDQRRPPWIALENVSFMLQLEKGQAMSLLVAEFESRGYRWAYRVVNTQSFLPQRRERVIFLATTSDIDPASVIMVDEQLPKVSTTYLHVHAHGFYWTEGVRGLGWAPDAIPTLKNGSTVGIASPPAIMLPNGGVVTPHIQDAERLQGFPENWTSSALGVGKASLRWSLVGNAVSVPVAEWLGARLHRPGAYDECRDSPLSENSRWPRAARGDGKARYKVEISAYPKWIERPSLNDFLQHQGKPLSVRATKGFLGRTERASLRFPDGFLERMRAHLEIMEVGQSKEVSYAEAAA